MIIKEKEPITGDFIDDAILRTVDDLEHHRDPTDKYIDDIATLPYIFTSGSILLNKVIENGGDIIIVNDADMDGITSSAIMYQFITKDLKYNKVSVLQHSGKAHGLTDGIMKQLLDTTPSLVILPDAATNNIEQQEILINNGIKFLVIDHHEISTDINNHTQQGMGLIINNQQLDMSSEFTGVGMTYMFCKYYSDYYKLNINVDKYLDLVALGQIADVSDVSDKEIRYYVHRGLENINNPFIKATMKHKDYDILTGRDASFSIISMCNAVCRIGTIEERELLFKAFTVDTEDTVIIEQRKKNKKTGKFDKLQKEVSYYTDVVMQCEKIKRRQDKIVKDALKDVNYLYNNSVLIGYSHSKETSINGLVAMKLADKYKKPVLITNDINSDIVKGSARCPDNFDFKQYLSDSNLFNYTEGHSQAFGWSISKDKLDRLYRYIDSNEIAYDSVHYVDKIFTKPAESDIIRVEVNKSIYGGKVEYPLFAYKEISFNKYCINKRGTMLTLFDNDVTFVLFNATDEFYNELISSMENNFVKVDVVGEPRLSSFSGKNRSEIIIKDIEIVSEIEENVFGIDF